MERFKLRLKNTKGTFGHSGHCRLMKNQNLIFLRKELLKFVIDFNYKLEELNPKGNEFTCIFPGHDANFLSNKKIIYLPWHGVPVPINEKLQFLPKFLRIFIGDYLNIN